MTASIIPKEVATAATLLPYRRSDIRCRYLGYLCCGFSEEEALLVLGLDYPWLDAIRQDEEFASWEERIPDLRRMLSAEYTEMEFFRNFRMVMEKDHQVLRKALGIERDENGNPIPLSDYEQQYLLKLRGAYTPQQIQMVEVVLRAGTDDRFNFTDWVSKNQDVIQMSRTDTVTMKRASG